VHRDVSLSRDGALLAYATNRDNGVDCAVYVRSLRDGSEQRVFSRGGVCAPAGFSPRGGVLVVQHDSGRPSDNDLYLVAVGSGTVQHVTPHDDDSWFDEPVWQPDGTAFHVATNVGRNTKAVMEYDLTRREWSTLIDADWDLECVGDDSCRWLLVHANADGYSRLALHDVSGGKPVAEVPVPGHGVVEDIVFARDGSRLAYKFSSPVDPGAVWVCDLESGQLGRVTELPRAVPLDELREPELHRFESFDGESVPVFLWEPDGEGPFRCS
jgi:Tol biopolymer transport system component